MSDESGRELDFVVYRSAHTSGDKGKPQRGTWDDVKSKFLLAPPQVVDEKTYARHFLWGAKIDGETTKGTSSVKHLEIGVCDIDGKPWGEVQALIKKLRDKGYSYAFHTSYSHKGERGKYLVEHPEATQDELPWWGRIYMLLDRPVVPAEWPLFWSNLNIFCLSLGDSTCAPAGKHYLGPSHPPGAEDVFQNGFFDGVDLDVDAILNSQGAPELAASRVDALVGSERVDPREIFAFLVGRQKNDSHTVLGLAGCKAAISETGRYAEKGFREKTLYAMACFLVAKAPRGRAEDLAYCFEKGIRRLEAEGAPAYEDFIDKIKRAARGHLTYEETKVAEREITQARNVKEAWTEEQINSYIKSTGDRTNPAELTHAYLLTYAKGYFVFDCGAYHWAPSETVFNLKIFENLEDKAPGFERYFWTKKGRVKKSGLDMLEDNGATCDRVSYEMAKPSYFDPKTRILHVSQFQKDETLKAEYNAEIEAYFGVLCETDEIFESLMDALSQAPNLERSCVATFFHGPTNLGKSCIVKAVAQIWNVGIVPMRKVWERFNDMCRYSPVYEAAEGDWGGGRQLSKNLRSLISDGMLTVEGKYNPAGILYGYPRIFGNANKRDPSTFPIQSHSSDDTEALASRVLFIECQEAARPLFNYQRFIVEKRMVRHILHLAATRTRSKEYDRFGAKTDSYHQVSATDQSTVALYECMLKILEGKVDSAEEEAMSSEKPSLFVHHREVRLDDLRKEVCVELWVYPKGLHSEYEGNKGHSLKFEMKHRIVLDAVRSMAHGQENRLIHIGQHNDRYYRATLAAFEDFCVSQELITKEQLDLLLSIAHELPFKSGDFKRLDEEARLRRKKSVKKFLDGDDDDSEDNEEAAE